MGAAEELSQHPDFVKLHQMDPKGAEDLMREALQKDLAAKEPPLPSMEGRTPLEGNTVDDRFDSTTGAPMLSLGEAAANVGRTVRGGVLPTAGGMAGAFVGGMTGPAAPVAVPVLSGLGAEAGNVVNKALGWQPGKWNEPDMSDVLALTTPALTQVVRHPIATVKNILAPFAKSSQMGQEAANSAVQLQGAKLGADYDYSVASQAKAKAQLQLDYEQQVGSWNTLKAAQVTAKRQAAEDLRQLTNTLKSRNVTDAARWAANRPGVPDDMAVRDAYAAADTLASAHTMPITLPEVTAAKKTILSQADVLAKQPGGEAKAQALRALATSGQENGISLTEANEIIKGLHQDIAGLRLQPSRYAQTEANAYSKIVDAYEAGMARLEKDGSIPATVRESVKAANALYLKQRTNQELTQFMTKDMVSPGPSGQLQLDPRAALKALDSKANERMVGYMRKVFPPDGNGQNLYDMTKDTLTKLAESGVKEWEAARLLTKTGGMTLPPPPVNPLPPQHALPYPEPQGGLTSALGTLGLRAGGAAAGFALGGGAANPYVGVGGAAVGLGAPEVFAKLMQTGWGQRTLLALVKHQGTTISPALVALATAAVRAGQPQGILAPPSPGPAQ